MCFKQPSIIIGKCSEKELTILVITSGTKYYIYMKLMGKLLCNKMAVI